MKLESSESLIVDLYNIMEKLRNYIIEIKKEKFYGATVRSAIIGAENNKKKKTRLICFMINVYPIWISGFLWKIINYSCFVVYH